MQNNTTISFDDGEKINFAKDSNKQKDTKENKEKEKSPEALANEKLNAIMQEFAKSSDKVKEICEYRGINIFAKKGYGNWIEFYIGKDLNEAFSIATPIDMREAAYYEKNYMQRFSNGYNKLVSDGFIKELQGQLQKARDTKAKALKAYEKETINKDNVAELRNTLNEMLTRQAELHAFLGRASDVEKERLRAVYGDDFVEIVREKFQKQKDNN